MTKTAPCKLGSHPDCTYGHISEDDNRPVLPTYDPAVHLVFDTEADAVIAEAQISEGMGFKPGNTTSRWDTPRQCADGRWIFGKPPI